MLAGLFGEDPDDGQEVATTNTSSTLVLPTVPPTAAAPTTTEASTTTTAVRTTTLAPTTTPSPSTANARSRSTTTAAPAFAAPSGCHPSYEGACVPADASDVDCAGGSGNGPAYVGRVSVVGPDVYDLDRDGDGVGCEG